MANPKAKQHMRDLAEKAFDAMDKNDDGKVCMSEFRNFCSGMDDFKPVAQVFCEVDTSDDMQVSVDELEGLLNGVSANQIEEGHVKDLFRKADTSGNGTLDKEEFHALLVECGYPESTIRGTIDDVCGGDGKVSLNEFLNKWVHDS